jgi:hypothetical protein
MTLQSAGIEVDVIAVPELEQRNQVYEAVPVGLAEPQVGSVREITVF